MKCNYCDETAESKLLVRSSMVNGIVKSIDICLSCFWFKRIRVAMKDGKILSKKKAIGKPELSGRSDSTSLRERTHEK